MPTLQAQKTGSSFPGSPLKITGKPSQDHKTGTGQPPLVHVPNTACGCRVITEAGNQKSKSLVRALWQRPQVVAKLIGFGFETYSAKSDFCSRGWVVCCLFAAVVFRLVCLCYVFEIKHTNSYIGANSHY